MSRHVVTGLLLAAVLVMSASLAAASVPDPPNSTVAWVGPFFGSCTFPAICPKGDTPKTVNVTVHDQFGAPMAGILASEVVAQGSCMLGGGSPCSQVILIQANGPTDVSGFTTITIAMAGGCCVDLQIVARGVLLSTLSYRSFDYTADLKVNLADLGFFAATFNNTSNLCFDFDCNGTVNLADLGFFAAHFNHAC